MCRPWRRALSRRYRVQGLLQTLAEISDIFDINLRCLPHFGKIWMFFGLGFRGFGWFSGRVGPSGRLADPEM